MISYWNNVKTISICIVFLSLLLSSCSIEDGYPHYHGSNHELIIKQAIIDSTDLMHLPKDTGGVQRAFPLDSTDANFAHYLYTPSGYVDTGPDYPCIVYLHGWESSGDSSIETVLHGGPPRMIHDKRWKTLFPFIVASPKLVTVNNEYWRPQELHRFFEYLINKYRINTKRIYVTGLSLGGGGCWYYCGTYGTEGYVAATIPISSCGHPGLIEKLAPIPVWAFHGQDDQTVHPVNNYGSLKMVNEINKLAPAVKAKATIFLYTGHNAWSRTYSNSFCSNNSCLCDPFDMNIYDWLLQYKKQ